MSKELYYVDAFGNAGIALGMILLTEDEVGDFSEFNEAKNSGQSMYLWALERIEPKNCNLVIDSPGTLTTPQEYFENTEMMKQIAGLT